MSLDWRDDVWLVELDDTMMFHPDGGGREFFNRNRQDAEGPNGNYVMWYDMSQHYLYRDTDGAFSTFETSAAAMEAAERWCQDKL